jgi:uncharacterized protein (DUF2249 family)
MSSTAAPTRTVDIRCLGSCTDRKAHVLGLFDALPRGESLVVLNDHLPNGLRRHLEELRPGGFGWTAIENGPELFRVEITKTA